MESESDLKVGEVLDKFKLGIKRHENLIELEAFVLVDIYWYYGVGRGMKWI